MSLVDVKEIEIALEIVASEIVQLKNPLGTSYDIASIYLNGSEHELPCSPFLHVWDEETAKQYQNTFGVWLYHTNEHLFLNVGTGNQDGAPNDILALFFPLDESMKNST